MSKKRTKREKKRLRDLKKHRAKLDKFLEENNMEKYWKEEERFIKKYPELDDEWQYFGDEDWETDGDWGDEEITPDTPVWVYNKQLGHHVQMRHEDADKYIRENFSPGWGWRD